MYSFVIDDRANLQQVTISCMHVTAYTQLSKPQRTVGMCAAKLLEDYAH